jgi:hypothetical protein
VDAVGLDREGDVGAGIYEESSGPCPVVSGSRFSDCLNGFASQGFQVAGGEIFFAELDVVHAGADCF